MPRRKTLKLSTPADIRRSIGRISNMILNGEIDAKGEMRFFMLAIRR